MLDRKLLRDLLRLRASILGILAIIALGVMCLVMLGSAYQNLIAAKDDYYAESRMAEFWIDLRRAPEAILNDLAEVPGILTVQSRIVDETNITIEGVVEPITAQVVSLPPDDVPGGVNRIVLMRGTMFTDSAAPEALLNDAFARAHGLHPGDTIEVLLNERRQALRVVGTAISAEFTYLIPPGGLYPEPETYGVLYLPQEFAEDALGYSGAFNQVVGLFAPGVYQQEGRRGESLHRLEYLLEPYGVLAVTPREDQVSHWILTAELAELRTMAVVIPAIFLAAAALILNALIGRLVAQQRTTVGALKAMGYTSRELFAHFGKFGLIIGLAGGIIGVVLGHILAVLLTDIYQEFFEFPRLDAEFHAGVAVAGLVVSLVFALLGVLRGAWQVMRMNPAAAMRPAPPERGGRMFLESWPWLWSRLGFRWHTVLRTITRHPARTFSGMFAAACGAALVFMSLSMYSAVHYMVDFQFRMILVSDLDVTLYENRSQEALLEVARLPGVLHAEGVFTLPCTLESGHRSRRMAVTGLEPGAQLTVPRDLEGRPVPVPPAGIMLTRTLAETLGVRVGDHLVLSPIRGDRTARNVPVASIVDSFMGMDAYADYAYLNRLVGETEAVSMLQLLVERGAETEANLLRELRDRPAVATVGSNRLRRENVEELLVEQMTMVLGFLIGFAGILFFGSTLSAARMSLADRQREVATLRVLGYTPREVGAIFLRESLVVQLAGALAGLPIGYLLLRWVISLADTEVFRIPLVIEPMAWVAPVLLGAGFTLLSHVPTQRAIRNMNWLEIVDLKE